MVSRMILSLRALVQVAAIAAMALAMPTAARAIPLGSCECGEEVPITDLQQCVNIFLDPELLTLCRPCDLDLDDEVGIAELQGVVNCFLDSTATNCPMATACGGPAECGNGMVESPEECDDGGSCFSGSRLGLDCTSNAECPGGTGDPCQAAGGDGCANNCTLETETTFVFTGAKCFGGAKNNQLCKFESFCSAGSPKPGRPCGNNADCGIPGGVCVTECGADSRGCYGDGECQNNNTISCPVTETGMVQNTCATGASAGLPCTSSADCGGAACQNACGGTNACLNKSRAALISLSVPILIGPLIGQQTSRYGKPGADGIIPIANPSAATSFNPVKVPGLVCACVRGGQDPAAHGPGNSGSGLINCGANPIENDVSLAVDHSTAPARRCFGGANAGQVCSPRCAPNGTNAGQACRVLGSNATECPGATPGVRICQQNFDCPGGTCTISNGPGICSANSTNAGRACFDNTQCLGTGAQCQGRCFAGANVGATCSCTGSPASGLCANTTECGAAGQCAVTGILGGGTCMGPPKFCVNGPTPGKACFNNAECGAGGTCQGSSAAQSNFLAWCDDQSDCPNSFCNSPDDIGCNDTDPAPPLGSGDVACLETRETCTSGPLVGQPCTTDAFCGSGGVCGNSCNTSGDHPNVCNSATHIDITGAGTQGSALLLSTTAIGTIGAPDGGTCSYAAKCAGGTNSGTACQIDLDCPGGACAGAICGGFCSGTTPANAGCLSNADCTGNGVCVQGSAFNTKCTVAGPCGQNGVCIPVEAAKGIDGRPCTADDAPAAQGVPNTIPQTTGRSITTIIDANASAGAQLVHLACIGGAIQPALCGTSVVGTKFDCNQVTQPAPMNAGVRLANTFPTVDGQTGDGAVSTFLTAR